MLFTQRFWAGLADGTVTVAFRRWKRPSVKEGGTLQSRAGRLGIDEVARIELEAITDEDARAAGYPHRDAVIADLRPAGDLYRIRFHAAGADPRVELRNRTDLDEAELAELLRTLRRSTWAAATLRLIAAHPGTVSTELAPQLGLERLPFKARVRRLKALGLTESLAVGYRLSPRGEAVLGYLD